MRQQTFSGFRDELSKIASMLGSPKADLVGLGLLGVPVADKLMDRKSSKKEKAMAGVEGAGLGVLAGHTLANMPKHAALRKVSADFWNPSTGAVIGDSVGSRAANRGTSTAAAPAPATKPAFTMEHLTKAKADLAAKGITPGSAMKQRSQQMAKQVSSIFKKV